MNIKQLTIENYKSFQFPTTIKFPSGIAGKSIFLIGGMNGAGKTSLTESINICLYGAKQDFIYKSINRAELAKGNCFVAFELIFLNEEMQEIIIKRSWSAGTVDTPKPKDLSEKLVVIKDGKRVAVQNKEMWQDYINSTIPRSITQFFFFDGEKIQEIAADDHSEVRLKSSLEAALGIQYISRLAMDVLKIKTDERKIFIEISDEDIEFKESELKKEKVKLSKRQQEKVDLKDEIEKLKQEYKEAKKRFVAAFSSEPESIEETKKKERKRIQFANKLGHAEGQIKSIMEKYIPWAIAGKLFPKIKEQIEKERDTSTIKMLEENSLPLANEVVEVFDKPTPLLDEPLSEAQRVELKTRIVNLLTQSEPKEDIVLNLTDRDAAKVLNQIDEIEQSEVLSLREILIESEELKQELKILEETDTGLSSETDKQLFEELQQLMEGYQTQIGRQSVRLQNIEEDAIIIENRIEQIEVEIGKLYGKHNISQEKSEFINECDTIANLLNAYIVKLRKNKIHLLQEKTFEMYKLLSSKAGLIKDLEINEKTYEITIKDRYGHEMKKSGLSAGEKEIFAVSLLWGLAQTSQLKLPIIIDTPLSRLDSIHRDNIVNQYFPNAADQVIILSTDTEIDNDYFKALEPHLSGAGKLVFSQINELTTYETGYFWN